MKVGATAWHRVSVHEMLTEDPICAPVSTVFWHKHMTPQVTLSPLSWEGTEVKWLWHSGSALSEKTFTVLAKCLFFFTCDILKMHHLAWMGIHPLQVHILPQQEVYSKSLLKLILIQNGWLVCLILNLQEPTVWALSPQPPAIFHDWLS